MSSEPIDSEKWIAIAGGGIAGLYCAWELAKRGHQAVVLEASPDRWGGRIETSELDGFLAEFGPMRYKLSTQPRFRKLVIEELKLELEPFTPTATEIIDYPKYDSAVRAFRKPSFQSGCLSGQAGGAA